MRSLACWLAALCNSAPLYTHTRQWLHVPFEHQIDGAIEVLIAAVDEPVEEDREAIVTNPGPWNVSPTSGRPLASKHEMMRKRLNYRAQPELSSFDSFPAKRSEASVDAGVENERDERYRRVV